MKNCGRYLASQSPLGQLFDCQDRMMESQKKANKMFITEWARHKQMHSKHTRSTSCWKSKFDLWFPREKKNQKVSQ